MVCASIFSPAWPSLKRGSHRVKVTAKPSRTPVLFQITCKPLQLNHIKTKLILMQIFRAGPPGPAATRSCTPKLTPALIKCLGKKVGSFLLTALSLSLSCAKSFHDLKSGTCIVPPGYKQLKRCSLSLYWRQISCKRSSRVIHNQVWHCRSLTHAAVLNLKNNICDYIISSDLLTVWRKAEFWH